MSWHMWDGFGLWVQLYKLLGVGFGWIFGGLEGVLGVILGVNFFLGLLDYLDIELSLIILMSITFLYFLRKLRLNQSVIGKHYKLCQAVSDVLHLNRVVCISVADGYWVDLLCRHTWRHDWSFTELFFVAISAIHVSRVPLDVCNESSAQNPVSAITVWGEVLHITTMAMSNACGLHAGIDD